MVIKKHIKKLFNVGTYVHTYTRIPSLRLNFHRILKIKLEKIKQRDTIFVR